MAKLETSVSLYGDKLELKVYGYNDKIPVLLSKVLAMIKSFSPRDDRFMVYAIALNMLPLIYFPRYCLFSFFFFESFVSHNFFAAFMFEYQGRK